jgi:hypothetical protein
MSNDGRGAFYAKRALGGSALSGSVPDPSYGVALGDLDGDGDLDAVIANDAGAPSVAYQNDGRGNFTAIGTVGGGQQQRRAVALGDLDRDGDLDVVLVGLGQDYIFFNENRGRQWTQRPLGARPAGRATGVAIADVDGDDDLDIVVPGRYEADTLLFVNDGKGGFTERTVNRKSSVWVSSFALAASSTRPPPSRTASNREAEMSNAVAHCTPLLASSAGWSPRRFAIRRRFS